MEIKTVVVTGGNKGIGFFSTRDLCLSEKVEKVIFTYRKEEDGKKAYEELVTKYKVREEKLDRHQLDITSSESIERFFEYLKKKYGSITVLLNNAGIAINTREPFREDVSYENAKSILSVNFFGTMNLTERLYELIDPEAGKIISVGSVAGEWVKFSNEDLKNQFYKCKTLKELRLLCQEFLTSFKEGTLEEKGHDVVSGLYPAYSLSKLCIARATRIFADHEKEGRIVCCLCPGFVKTDMNGHLEGGRSEEDGGEYPVHVILNSTKEYNGGFYKEKIERVDMFD